MRLCLLIFGLIMAFFGICYLDCEVEDYTKTLGVIFTRKFIEYLNKI